MNDYQKKILIICFLFGLIVGHYPLKIFAQEVSPTPTPTSAINPSSTPIISSPTPSLTMSPSPTISSPTPTNYPSPKIIIYALSACPSDSSEFVQLKNLEDFALQINSWQLIDLAGGTELLTELSFNEQEILQINLNKIRLNNSGDELSLYDQDHNLIDKVSYQNCQKNQITFFYQTTPSPTTALQATPTVIVESTPAVQLELMIPTPTATSTPILPATQNFNYKMPIIKIAKYSPPHLHLSQQQQNPTVESTLLTPLLINRWPILSVIIGGAALITLGSFFIYEDSNQIN